MVSTLLLLIFGHFLCDYPLQGDYLARGKNRFNPLPGTPWFWCLVAHSGLHAGAVLLITHNPILAVAEWVVHCFIDDIKCMGKLTYTQDQLVHLACKFVWWAAILCQ